MSPVVSSYCYLLLHGLGRIVPMVSRRPRGLSNNKCATVKQSHGAIHGAMSVGAGLYMHNDAICFTFATQDLLFLISPRAPIFHLCDDFKYLFVLLFISFLIPLTHYRSLAVTETLLAAHFGWPSHDPTQHCNIHISRLFIFSRCRLCGLEDDSWTMTA